MSGNNNGWTKVVSSVTARSTINPIRALVGSGIKEQKGKQSDQPMINMSLGDPTIYGNLKTPEAFVELVKEKLESYKCNGYLASSGDSSVKKAIADRHNLAGGATNFDASDVFLTCGGSGAIELALAALCAAGDNILLPKPGFPLYKIFALSKGFEYKHYNLIPEKQWEIDLEQLESLIDAKTKAVLINNPSNPCGSNWSKQHILDIIEICNKHKIPIISDEIYDGIVFENEVCYPAAALSTQVPVITLSGLAKRYLVPGWRIGWLTIHDPLGVMGDVKSGIASMTALLNGPNSFVQLAIPELFNLDLNETFFKDVNKKLQTSALIAEERANKIRGLKAIRPQGSMYIMVMFDPTQFDETFKNGIDLFYALAWEEHVEVLPGDLFDIPNSIRLVTSTPPEKISEAFDRIEAFCSRHYV
ncbi:hypothetical protein BB559_002549 [Furculomyces boomerangus]|uniref:Aminotransferase class I/classII large domain-containing protein n=2 Tax=Harpellales TaxID=61421 RepID=A0A2T9YUF5_9FUNG|nr:hypothetical protein BB559_002549 [Furculomyces boomerangus]PWA01316.1 hypothetical protein BB558_002597 [Smittium angustum]